MQFSLSMWNFHSWFLARGISHAYSIRSTGALIAGVRLLSAAESSGSYALLSDSSHGSEYQAVLSYGEDHIYFHDLRAVDVMDEINYMFAIHYHWQQALRRINLSHGSLKELLSLCNETMPYPIIIFRGDELLAYSPHYEEQALEIWDHFSSMPISETLTRLPTGSPQQTIYESLSPILSNSSLFRGKQMVLSNILSPSMQYTRVVAFANGQPLSPSDVQLMSELTNAIQCNLTICEQRNTQACSDPNAYFISCQNGTPDYPADSVLNRLGWNREDRFTVFRFELSTRDPSIILDKLYQYLQLRFPHAHCLEYGNSVQLICDLEQSDDLPTEEFVLSALPANSFIVSQSNISADFSLIPQLIRQSKDTLEKAYQRNAAFLTSTAIMLDYISQTLRDNTSVQSMVHPAIRSLMYSDENQASSYYLDTLRAYLYFGENCNAAAKHLNIHRNTLISRLERIKDITGLSLDDPKEREALQLSLLIESASELAK